MPSLGTLLLLPESPAAPSRTQHLPQSQGSGSPPDQTPLGTQWKFNQEKVQGTTSPGCSKAKGRRTPKLEEQQGRE